MIFASGFGSGSVLLLVLCLVQVFIFILVLFPRSGSDYASGFGFVQVNDYVLLLVLAGVFCFGSGAKNAFILVLACSDECFGFAFGSSSHLSSDFGSGSHFGSDFGSSLGFLVSVLFG